MSYILDALRRADAQRRQGRAPGLQQVAAAPEQAPGAARSRRTRPWAAGLAGSVLLVAAALVLGWWWGRKDPRAPAPARPQPAASAPMAAPAPSGPLAPAPAPAQARARTPTRAPAPRPRVAAPTRTRSSATAATAASLATAGHGSASSAVAGPARAASAAQAAKDERPLPAAVLPEPLRSRVAALVFGGAVQSQERRQSFVLMAGRIVREGEALAPGIVLERIGARSLLLRVDGQAVDLPL